MDVTTLRFILLFLLIVIGLIVIPYLYVYMLSRKYGYDCIPFYYLIPVLVIYLFLFCRYCPELVPEHWKLEPVEVYHCEWKTEYRSNSN